VKGDQGRQQHPQPRILHLPDPQVQVAQQHQVDDRSAHLFDPHLAERPERFLQSVRRPPPVVVGRAMNFPGAMGTVDGEAARLQHPVELRHRGAVVADVFHHRVGEHHVKRLIGERQRLGRAHHVHPRPGVEVEADILGRVPSEQRAPRTRPAPDVEQPAAGGRRDFPIEEAADFLVTEAQPQVIETVERGMSQ
jgi:hypothetical protein